MRVVVGLLAVCALIAFSGPVVEGRDRSAERAVRSYLDAIQVGDVNAALNSLEPATRGDWRIFVEHQSGDQFRVLALAVQREPLVSGLSQWGKPFTVTVTAEISGKGGERWQATSYVVGRVADGAWYAENPPFGPDEPWLIPPES